MNNIENNLDKLLMYSSAITRAHGKNHPEVFQVYEIVLTLPEKIKQSLDLKPAFQTLRQITNNYAIPDDVCPTFRATYQLLEQLDPTI